LATFRFFLSKKREYILAPEGVNDSGGKFTTVVFDTSFPEIYTDRCDTSDQFATVLNERIGAYRQIM
jgi:hypothetical protein